MAKVEGLKEKLHFPLYDAFFVPPPLDVADPLTFGGSMTDPRVIRFFVDVQNKTKLETNMQAAGTLPSQNSFDARSLRVVVSNLVQKKEDKPEKLKDLLTEAEFVAALINNSVTTLLVGEKTMIEMPTFGFPSGAGVFSGFPAVATSGIPNPLAVFRFAEPVMIESQQNFRVEMQFPRDVPRPVAKATGPLRLWVVLDGYMVRDVQ